MSLSYVDGTTSSKSGASAAAAAAAKVFKVHCFTNRSIDYPALLEFEGCAGAGAGSRARLVARSVNTEMNTSK